MNALVGKVRPGDFGVDLMHLNLHKTFSTPHGGGGPGSGPVACKKFWSHSSQAGSDLEIRRHSGLRLRPAAIDRAVRSFYGNFGMFVRALAYILANGPDGLRQTTEDAVLNANYIRKGLEGPFRAALQEPVHARSGFQRQTAGEKRRQAPWTSPSD